MLTKIARTKLRMLATEGRHDEYIDACRQNLRWARLKIGEQSMSACIALVDLADGLRASGDTLSAAQIYRDALDVLEKKRGKDNGMYKDIEASLAELIGD